MWSLGAVLYHILSGTPPYMGRADDRGAQMLRTIMTTDPDMDVLRTEGVSEEGIDFVAQLLNRDPHARPNEHECLQHPWIADVPDVDEYEDEQRPADERGTLPPIGEASEDELDASQLSLNDKSDGEDDDPKASLEEKEPKRPRVGEIPAEIRYPSLPNIESFEDVLTPPRTNPRRLFGEITGSAAHSADAFGLGVDAIERAEGFSDQSSVSSGSASSSGNESLASATSLSGRNLAGSAPSLMGAEALIGRLNMDTPDPATPNATPNATTPRSPVGRDETPASEGVPDPEAKPPAMHPPDETTPKAKEFRRRIELPSPNTWSEERAKKGPAKADEEEFDVELATTIDARTGRAVSELPATTYAGTDDSDGESRRAAGDPYVSPTPSVSGFTKPPPLLGKLTTLPGSIFDLTIRLHDRMTSWGRGPQATVCHPDRMDTRIPAYALEITFWAPAIESRIAAGEDWMTVPDVMAILSTKTRKCIWVNGVELRRGPASDSGCEGFHFGKLYTGDIITVYQHRDRYLKFRCEFYHGDSARPRPEREKGFHVRKVLMPKADSKQNRQPPSNEKRRTNNKGPEAASA
ncbi:hypothetical protein VTN02DRAFT_6661 [Thermoascus thermophilus]